ncbi:unnamed protein product [Thelazia callipaeda]|uniref:NARG2_C domain-containing protein n=1 Tax=Thelazia callipaeda TaxID=103827 RepID=A0A0N5CQH0_THECL|nr:unnamed protein product [Thelazia callipaeda]
MSTSCTLDSRRNSDTVVRFRNSNEVLAWNCIDRLECDLNAVVHRGRFSEDEDERIREGSLGKFTVISERAVIDRSFAEKQIRMEVSISQLEKRGKMKHTDLETYLTIYKKCLHKNDYIIIYRSPTTLQITSTSLHKFPEIVISCDKLLSDGFEDRIIYFTLRNAANGDVIGEADILYTNLVSDGKINLKLRSRDLNGNPLFSVSKRSLHPVGVLHINSYIDNNVISRLSRGSSASSQSSTENRSRHSVKNSLDEESLSQTSANVMLASGFAYLKFEFKI